MTVRLLWLFSAVMVAPTSSMQRRLEQQADPGLQLAPSPDEGPNMPAVVKAFKTTVRDCSSFIAQCRQNYETRYAIWQGQSADGKKHAREGDKITPTPWDGASDLRVYLTDEAINLKVAMLSMARRLANLVSVPTTGHNIERAKVVGMFMRWLINTQVPEVDREDELLAQYLQEKGLAITGQFWETTQERTLDTLRLEDFARLLPPNIDVAKVIAQPQLADMLGAILREHYDISRAKSKTMLRELVEKGETTVPVLGREISRPVVRAFNLDEDIFVPPYTTDLEMAPYIFRVQYYTAEKLRSFVVSDGWDKDWVEAAITKCRGKLVSMIPDRSQQPIARSYVFNYERYQDLIGVVYAYQRLSDEDGVPGKYLTIFHPELPADNLQQGYAKHGLLGFRHGAYPFVLHRREFLSRRIHDTRGVPEVGKSYQDQIKAHRDSRIDAASVAILPPIMFPAGRPPGSWGPGARIPERRQGEYHYADKPTGDVNTENSEKILTASFRGYFSSGAGEEMDGRFIALLNQFETDRYLGGWAAAYRQIWKLYQQYGPDQQIFRVIGLQKADPAVMEKGDPSEDFDFYLSFDALQFDREQTSEKVQQIIEICTAADRNGQTDWSQLMQIALENIDPTLAERIIMPHETATQKMVDQVQGDLAGLAGGVPKDFKPGTPPQLAMQIMQQWMQQPDVQNRMFNDEAFKARVEKYGKQAQFQQQQRENARIGRLGA